MSSLVLENSSDLTSLGNAIRSKTGGSSNLTIAQMATAVSGLVIDNKSWSIITDITPDTGYSNQSVSYTLSSYNGTDGKNWIMEIPMHTNYDSTAQKGYVLVSPLFQYLTYPANTSNQYWYFPIPKSFTNGYRLQDYIKKSNPSSVSDKIYGWVSPSSYSFTNRVLTFTSTTSGTNGIYPGTIYKAKLLVLN